MFFFDGFSIVLEGRISVAEGLIFQIERKIEIEELKDWDWGRRLSVARFNLKGRKIDKVGGGEREKMNLLQRVLTEVFNFFFLRQLTQTPRYRSALLYIKWYWPYVPSQILSCQLSAPATIRTNQIPQSRQKQRIKP